MGFLDYYDDPDALSSRFREEDAWPYAPPSNIPGGDANAPYLPAPVAGAAAANIPGPPLSILPPGLQAQGQIFPTAPQRPQMAQDPYHSDSPMGGLTQLEFNNRFNAAAGGANPTRILQGGMPPTVNDESRFDGRQFDQQTYAPKGGASSWLENVNPENPGSNERQSATRSTSSKTSPTQGNTRNAQLAFEYFVKQGFSPAQAAGIVGNLQGESGHGLNPDGINHRDGRDRSDSIGIAQWNGTRAQALKDYAASKGTAWNDLTTQLEFLHNELKGTERAAYKRLMRAQNAEDSAQAMLSFERPKDWNVQGAHPERAENAVAVLAAYGGGGQPGQAQEPEQQQVQASLRPGASPIPFVNMRQSTPAIDLTKLSNALQASGGRQVFLGR